MDSGREIRYYASISRLVWLLLVSLAFVLIGWLILTGNPSLGNIIFAWIDIAFFGLGVVVFSYQILMTIIARKPMLQVNSAGISTTPPLQLTKTGFVPWDNIARISVGVQAISSRTKQYYLLIEACHSERTTDPNKQSLTARMYPSLGRAAIVIVLNSISFTNTRKRRTQLLERIETTFAPEIIQYNVVVDKVERPL